MSQELEHVQLKVEEKLYKLDQDKLIEVAESLDIGDVSETQSKAQMLKVFRKAIDAVVDKEGDESTKISWLQTLLSRVDENVLPPLEESAQEKEISALTSAYEELLKSFESQKKDILAKLDQVKGSALGTGTKDSLSPTETPGSPTVELEVMGPISGGPMPTNAGVQYPWFHREFKIMGQIGEPGQADKLTFVSLSRQVDVGVKKGYRENEIIDAVVRAISPHSSLRSYVESLPELTLAKLRKILRIHYREKTASELYHQLATTFQTPKETPQQFLLRALDIRNKVIFSSQEDDCEFNYGTPLIQNTFLKSFETGLRDDILTTNLRPILRSVGITDEDLMKQVNELASHQAERQTKLGADRQKQAKAAACHAQQEVQKEPAPQKPDKTNSAETNKQLLAALKEMKAEIATLKEHVERSGSPAGSEGKPQRYGRGRGHAQKNNRIRGCPNCQAQGLAASCRHCFSCGGINHYAYECPNNTNKGGEQGNGSRLFPGDKD